MGITKTITSISKNYQWSIIGIIVVGIIGTSIMGYLFTYDQNELGGKISTSFLALSSQANMEHDLFYKIKIDNPHAKEIILECGSNVNCLMEDIKLLSEEENQETVLATVQDYLSALHSAGFYCHQQGHHMGKFLYGFLGNLPDALSAATITCGGSQIHGVMENYFTTELFYGNVPENIQISDACDVVGDNPESLIRFDCAHGLGHGLLDAYDYNIFVALERCKELETPREIQGCATGMFMANVIEIRNLKQNNPDYPSPETKNVLFDKDDPLYPCSKVEEQFFGPCMLYQTSLLLKELSFSTEEVFNVCDKITSKSDSAICYQAIGREISPKYLQFEDWQGLASECEQGPNLKTHKVCIVGGLLAIIDMRLSQGFELCQALDEKYKKACYGTIGNFIHLLELSLDEVEENCAMSDPEYSQFCYDQAVKGF